jgi:1-acyl-sn-glycerol-3-phosphate acyltransferase
MLYRLMRALVRLAVHLYFRRIDFEAPYNVPAVGPVLFVANHTNALVDPLVIMTAVRRPITVTAKNALANNFLLRWLMAACGVVTFHREQDVGQSVSRRANVESLRRCQELLAEGAAICIFPEGVSHSDSKLRPFRNGTARIALQYARENASAGRLTIVPVGLLYTAKDKFRSDVWVRFGAPLHVEKWFAQNPDASPAALTRVIEQRVAALTINTPSRREQLLLSWAADIVATRAELPQPLSADDRSTADWFQIVSRLQAGWAWLDENRPDVPQQLANRIRAYQRQLRRTGITPTEVFLPLNLGRAAFFLVRELQLMIIGGPLALFGAVNHAAPYFTVKWIAKKLSRDKDHWASNAIYASFLVFPFFYLILLAAVWLLLPVLWASIYTVALPYTGYYAVLYGDRFQRAWQRARTFLRFTRKPEEQQLLAADGRAIVEEIRALGQLVERDQPQQACEVDTMSAKAVANTRVVDGHPISSPDSRPDGVTL